MKNFIFFSIALVCCVCMYAQKNIYRVSFQNAILHEAHISLTETGITAKPSIFKISPPASGSYATHKCDKNVYVVTATGKNGKAISIVQ